MFDVDRFHTLRRGTFGARLEYFPELDSTNRFAAERAREGVEEGTVILAETQTAGRGRNTNSWYSPPHLNIYSTTILFPPMNRLHHLPFMVAISLADALEHYGVECDLKWPNDIQAGGKKIAGILIQTSMDENRLHFAIAGTGINVNAKDFPPNLQDTATSIFQITGSNIIREELLSSYLVRFEELYRKNEHQWDELHEMFARRSSYVSGCNVVIEQQGKITTGRTAGLDPFGGLILETEQGREIVYAGEVAACRKK